MIDKKIEAAFNEQINAELYSAYLYLSMATWFEDENLPGFAGWMTVQAQEETTHAMKFYRHILDRGGRVLLKGIDAPPTEWASPLAAFEAVLEHEKKVTGLINALADLTAKLNDHAASIFLQWLVTEQIEEEKSADDVIQKLRHLEKAPAMLFMLDRELGARTTGPQE